ncbi:DUF1269 domain-containing protein [bacterium]|nr:DUF1269 domain-containing protein [bacterium]
MSDLIVISFENESTAFELRSELIKLQKEYLLEMEDVVVVTRSEDMKVQLHQASNLTAMGAVGGGFWGMLIGLIFLNPLAGAVLGAGAGALSGRLSDVGINDDFMKELGRRLKPGTAAVFVLARKFNAEKVVERLGDFRAKGQVLQTSLGHDDEASLRAALEAKPV